MTIPRGRFLAAVFLDDSEPADPPPARLSIPDIGFASLSTGLRQTLFVEDGLAGTGAGSQQIFEVPDAATASSWGSTTPARPTTRSRAGTATTRAA